MVRSKSVIATPPGATIREQLEDRGMSQKELAARMGMSEKHISQLINGEVHLTPETAERLEMVLGVPARFWNNLEAIYQEKVARANAENNMDADIALAKKLPYHEMEKYHWVPKATTSEAKVIELRKFFEVAQLSYIENPGIVNIACRRLGGSEKGDFALLAWEQQARREARSIDVKPINIQKLSQQIPVIRAMTVKEPHDFCQELRDIMADCGIAVIFLPHLDGSFLHGATFYDGKKIVTGLTVRGKDADRFWFSLFHELGHIIKGHINKPFGTDAADEREADRFARDVLICEKDFTEFVQQRSFDDTSIVMFANRIGIAPGIVVGRLQKENYIPYTHSNRLKVQYEIEP